MDWYSIWPVKALLQRLAGCDSQRDPADTIAMKVASDYDILPHPAHVKLGPDYVDLKKGQFHWHYDGPKPGERLASWLVDLFGSSICVKIVSPKTGRPYFQRSFYGQSGFTEFLACVKEGNEQPITSLHSVMVTDGSRTLE